MSFNLNKSKILFLLIILNILSNIICILEIPIKQVKTQFNKLSNKKTSSIDNPSKISSMVDILEINLLAIDIRFGSNNQVLTILLDTGSDILWVAGPGSSNKNIYNPSNSETSKRSSERLNYNYAYGSIAGFYYNDQINFAALNSFYAYFGVASTINVELYDFDGILGLGRKYSNNKYSILNTIKNSGAISSTIFSFKYDQNRNKMFFYLGEEHEDFNINNIDKNKYLANCPLIKSKYYGTELWVCDIVSLGIKKDNTIVKKVTFNIEGLFDTGSNNIIFPSKYISDLQQTITSFNCFLYEEGNSQVGSQKAIYCRDGNNLPKITIGLRNHILTLGKSDFYDRIFVNNENVYRLRFFFDGEIDFCIIGQTFYYEYHTLFDDGKGVLKFYNEDDSQITNYVEKTSGISAWVIVLIIIGGVVIIGVIVFVVIYFCFCRKGEYKMLEKELLEMSSITKVEEQAEINNESNFNKVMNIKPTNSKKRTINIHIGLKN